MRTKTSLWDWINSNTPGDPSGGEPPAGDPPAGDPSAGDPPAGDPPAGDPPAGDPPSAYRPDGLPDNLYGESNEETIDKMALALKGYRDKDNNRGVPENAEGYSDFGDKVPDELKSHISGLAQDTVFQRLSAKALEKGMPVQDFQELTLDLYAAAQEMGALEPLIDVKAEQAALVPEAAKSLPEAEQKVAREKRMNDNFAFLDTLTAKDGKDGMSADVADYAKSMLGDSAKGHQFIEHMRSRISGGSSPIAGGDQGSGGSDPKEDLFRREKLPENTPGNPKYRQESYDKLQADYQKVYGD